MVADGVEYSREALVMDSVCSLVDHDVIKVNDHTCDASKDGGHDFLEAAEGGAQAKMLAGIPKDPHVSCESSKVVTVCM